MHYIYIYIYIYIFFFFFFFFLNFLYFFFNRLSSAASTISNKLTNCGCLSVAFNACALKPFFFTRLWSVYILLVISCVGAGNLYMRSYFPTIAVSQGATLDQAAMMVILVGLLDLISRLSLGFLADTHMLKSS